MQLGQTQVIGFVTGQLVQPYRDRPNEGTFAIYTEFSPMADPSFEPGRPGDFSIELRSNCGSWFKVSYYFLPNSCFQRFKMHLFDMSFEL